MPRRAVFLDRDGVINEDRAYVHRPEDFVLREGVPRALAEFQRQGFALVVITNQSGIARGYFTQRDFESLNCHMLATLATAGIQIAGVYCCPHGPEDGCPCRKPNPDMILRAAREHQLDLARSWLIGDKSSDIEAARRAGIPNTVFLRGRYAVDSNAGKPLYVCDNVLDIIRLVSSPDPPAQRGCPRGGDRIQETG